MHSANIKWPCYTNLSWKNITNLPPVNVKKNPKSKVSKRLKQFASNDHHPTGVLKYELKGLKKLAGANFRLRLIGGTVQHEALVSLIEDMGHEYASSYLSERLLRNFNHFDRLVIEHLQKIHTRKAPENCTVFFAKTPENLGFIITLLGSREVFFDETVLKPLILGESLTPRAIFIGNESHLKLTLITPHYLPKVFIIQN